MESTRYGRTTTRPSTHAGTHPTAHPAAHPAHTHTHTTVHERERRTRDAKAPAHGLAVAALVFGILGLIGLIYIGPLLALAFGYTARSRIKDRADIGGDGMAVAGIVLGWIGLLLSIIITFAMAALVQLFD